MRYQFETTKFKLNSFYQLCNGNIQHNYIALVDALCVYDFPGLKMQEDVAGATFMAVGSSAPEFFTSVIGRNSI